MTAMVGRARAGIWSVSAWMRLRRRIAGACAVAADLGDAFTLPGVDPQKCVSGQQRSRNSNGSSAAAADSPIGRARASQCLPIDSLPAAFSSRCRSEIRGRSWCRDALSSPRKSLRSRRRRTKAGGRRTAWQPLRSKCSWKRPDAGFESESVVWVSRSDAGVRSGVSHDALLAAASRRAAD